MRKTSFRTPRTLQESSNLIDQILDSFVLDSCEIMDRMNPLAPAEACPNVNERADRKKMTSANANLKKASQSILGLAKKQNKDKRG